MPTPYGQSLLMYILKNKFSKGFRELLELLLYENMSLGLNKSVVAIGLTGPDSSVDRVSAPGKGRSRVRSRAATYQS